jgi:hypothetical protein
VKFPKNSSKVQWTLSDIRKSGHNGLSVRSSLFSYNSPHLMFHSSRSTLEAKWCRLNCQTFLWNLYYNLKEYLTRGWWNEGIEQLHKCWFIRNTYHHLKLLRNSQMIWEGYCHNLAHKCWFIRNTYHHLKLLRNSQMIWEGYCHNLALLRMEKRI